MGLNKHKRQKFVMLNTPIILIEFVSSSKLKVLLF